MGTVYEVHRVKEIHLLKLYPAYGRRFSNVDELARSFLNGLDCSPFPTGGAYTSIRDFVGENKLPNLVQFGGVFLTQPEREVGPEPKRQALEVIIFLNEMSLAGDYRA